MSRKFCIQIWVRCVVVPMALLVPITMLNAQDTLTWNMIASAVVEHSPDIAKARAELQTAGTMQQLHIGDYLPEISFALSTSQNQQGPREVYLGAQSFRQEGQTFGYHSAGVSMSYTVFDWGNRHRTSEILDSRYKARRSSLVKIQRQVLEQAFTGFTDLLEQKEILEISREELRYLRRQRDFIKGLTDEGLQPAIDLRRIQVEIRNKETEISRQAGRYKQSRFTLMNIMGRELAGSTVFIPPAVPGDSTIGAQTDFDAVVNTHPATQELTAGLQTAKLERKKARWQMFPGLNLNTQYQRGNRRLEEVYGNFARNWNTSVSLQVSFPLYNQSAQLIEIERRTSQIRTISEDLRKQRQDAYRQVFEICNLYETQFRNYTRRRRNIADYKAIHAYERRNYRAGITAFRDYLNAVQSYLNARRSAVTAKYQLTKTAFRYELLTGKWDEVEGQ
ncbi:MAG: TolC family protein [Candidatus Marinimicrobia bacterium]|nr:TolC family protein [Candidatus Neomarinimicrobiota bacterium]MCF7829460.1 TolC family protein [Candidatus Neomarinimicrobiota bacterium]MCF7882339.1 TolC family protein [Candidatus Neomarinimicrobiota bacterium]